MHDQLKELQSDVQLYEDFITSSMYLDDFDEIFQPKQLGLITQKLLDELEENN